MSARSSDPAAGGTRMPRPLGHRYRISRQALAAVGVTFSVLPGPPADLLTGLGRRRADDLPKAGSPVFTVHVNGTRFSEMRATVQG